MHKTGLIKGEKIALDQIVKIKRNPLLISLITSSVLFYAAATALVLGVLLWAFTQDVSSYLLVLPAAGLVYSGIKPPNFLRGFKKSKNWKCVIIQ